MTTAKSDQEKSVEALLRQPVTSIPHHTLPIGVFDSGVGGLTVLRALREQLPHESFIYLGDTARLPYGTKSVESVVRYSVQAARFLVACGIKYLVVACNTASSVALAHLREQFAPLPVIGVIEPGAEAACASSRTGHIAVIATEGTIRGGAYQREIANRIARAVVAVKACSLFVSLAEEGWTEGQITQSVARRYLDEVLQCDRDIDTLLLGCTHFPVLRGALQKVVGPNIDIVDSAATTATSLSRDLRSKGLETSGSRSGSMRMLATDSADRFARVGSLFLGELLSADRVELVDLGPASTA